MPILAYTTTVKPEKTIGEIQAILSKRGARKIGIDYDEKGRPTALTFAIELTGRLVGFYLECKFPGIMASMRRDKVAKGSINEDQAIRTGWRIIKTWIEGQMAMVDADLMSLAEVFFSKAIARNGKTVFEVISTESDSLLLEA